MSIRHLGSIPSADRINYLNIGLMLVAVLVAVKVPFVLFLFAYAVLGPAHYLTEISWLHQRGYFTQRKYDYLLLGISALVVSLVVILMREPLWGEEGSKLAAPGKVQMTAWIVAFCLAAALAMVVKPTWLRMVCLLVVLVMAILSEPLVVLFAVFVPTLVHVYIFTGFFILYGAMKGRNRSGYISFAIFLLCPFLFLLAPVSGFAPGQEVRETYEQFWGLNVELFAIFKPDAFDARGLSDIAIFQSEFGVFIMRVIAFAYTYHYLNWFSKTSIIKWHQVSKPRMAVIAALWIGAVGIYAWDFVIGFKVLFVLSFLHVFLEFPLNHVTIIGVGRELKGMIFGGKTRSQPAAGR